MGYFERRDIPLSRNCADKSFVFEGAVSCVFWRWPAGQLWILLGKGGVAAPSSKWSRSFGGAARSVSPVGRNIKNGWFVQLPTIRWLEPTTPSAPAKEASRHFLNGRSHPSLSKEGTSAFPSVVFNAPVSSKRCGTWQAYRRGAVRVFCERRGGRSMMRSDLINIREAHRLNKERCASIYKVASRRSGPPRLRQ